MNNYSTKQKDQIVISMLSGNKKTEALTQGEAEILEHLVSKKFCNADFQVTEKGNVLLERLIDYNS